MVREIIYVVAFLIACVAIAVGFWYEDRIIQFERMVFEKIKRLFKRKK